MPPRVRYGLVAQYSGLGRGWLKQMVRVVCAATGARDRLPAASPSHPQPHPVPARAPPFRPGDGPGAPASAWHTGVSFWHPDKVGVRVNRSGFCVVAPLENATRWPMRYVDE